MNSISAKIKAICDIMQKDTVVLGDAKRISQMVCMLFMKIFPDKGKEWDLVMDNYKSPIPN